MSMKKKGPNAFTLIELLVVIAIIALLMAIMMPGLNRAREQGKRAMCLSNLKQLMLGWIMYTDDNDDKIVNGAPLGTVGKARAPLSSEWDYEFHKGELPWVGVAWSSSFLTANETLQREAITTGALYKYCKNVGVYRCPTGYRGEMLTYVIVDSMNGLPRDGTQEAGVWMKGRSKIRQPYKRIVFIDEGWVTPDSYAVHFVKELWWDDPMVRHSDGTTMSFADGHTEHWIWKGTDTITYGRSADRSHPKNNVAPGNGKQDLYRIQIGTWSRLGYEPSIKPDVDF